MDIEWALARDAENYRHMKNAGLLEARQRLIRAAEEVERYGYDITIYIRIVEETTGG